MPPCAPRHMRHARCPRVGGVEEVFEELRRDVVRGVDAEGVHTHLAHPVAEAVAQGASHLWVLGIQVVQTRGLEVHLFSAHRHIADVRRPVVDARATVFGAARVV